jgi:hypothetical protein
VVDAPLPTQANRDILPMSTGVPILPTQSAQITGRPQTLVYKIGRFVISKAESEKGAFKTPTLRNITQTAPYMHDGSEATLTEVVEFYNRGGIANPYLSKEIKPLGLNAGEIAMAATPAPGAGLPITPFRDTSVGRRYRAASRARSRSNTSSTPCSTSRAIRTRAFA